MIHPFFSELLSAIKSGDGRRIRRFFSGSSLDQFRAAREKVRTKLLPRQLTQPVINVRREKSAVRHKRDNLHSCVSYHGRMVRRSSSLDELDKALMKFKDDYEAAAQGGEFPFGHLLAPQVTFVDISEGLPGVPRPRAELGKEIGALERVHLGPKSSDRSWDDLLKEDEAEEHKLLNLAMFDRAYYYIDLQRTDFKLKRESVLSHCKRLLSLMEEDRGKPGRHRKPYNILVHDLINACTKPKRDKGGGFRHRKDGQYRLERNWDLIVLLLLDVHLNAVELPGLVPFVQKNATLPAGRAIKKLRTDLWNRFKNFPSEEGWSFGRKPSEIGAFHRYRWTPPSESVRATAALAGGWSGVIDPDHPETESSMLWPNAPIRFAS